MLIEKPQTGRIIITGYLIVAGFLIVILRLWQLQVIQGADLRKVSEANRLRFIGVTAPRGIIFDRNGIPLVRNAPYFCASVIPEEFDKSRINELSTILGIPTEELLNTITKKAQSPFTPVRLKEGLSFKEVCFIEARRSDIPGLMIDIEVSRSYIYGSTGGHIIGYLGKMTPAQAKDPAFRDVPPDAFIGQWGIEKLYDKHLRGIAGQRVVEVDALGHEIRLLRENPSISGEPLTLSIDIAVQQEVARAFEGKAGAMVAIKPETGEILGMVSAPSFDPNKFSTGIKRDDWIALNEDKKLPLLNRAIQSQYPPGSTFKIVTAIAGLETGAITPSTAFNCSGGLTSGKWHFGCWKKGGHGTVSIHRALVESCDVFFYEDGKRLGIDRLYEYSIQLGLGTETGISLGNEKKGLIPNSRWKRETKKSEWFLGETFVNSIGQGYVSATPIQMALMMSIVANGGSVYQPMIIKDSTPVQLRKVDLKPSTLEIVKEGLRGVVNEPGGTGKMARSPIVTVGGKTGTAQVVSIRKESSALPEKFRDHAWFVAFAPVEKPEIALSVFVEHGGHGGGAAAPIAKKAIDAYFLTEEKKKELLNVQY